jgi:YidC/Oxa1 family membrane protein insertase
VHLDFLYIAVSWVLLRWHQLFTAIGLNKAGGLNWALSIIFLVITARLLLFRFFIKQVHYQRHMQLMQPKIQQLREKYKNDRATMQREMMKLQQEEGFNPVAGCLPMLLQIPIFISLFHVLRHLSNSVGIADRLNTNRASVTPGELHKLTLYGFTQDQTTAAAKAKLFGAPLAASLRDNAFKVEHLLGGDLTSTRTVTLFLVLISAAATYLTQILVRRGQPTEPVGTAATVQKLMLYFIPVSVLFSGLIFPLGVLLYWFTSNVWTLGQQFYINKFHPHVPAETAPSGELGKKLAPRPGQKPSRDRRTINVTPADVVDDEVPPDHAPPTPPRTGTPRPGARPNRGSNRPGGKRPSQAKKRR